MTFHALAGLMADITAAVITVGCFSVTVLSLVCHPVAAIMGNRFLVFVAIDAIASGVAVSAGPPVMGCLSAMPGGFPAKDMIFRFFCLMALFTESLTVRVAVVTRVCQATGEAVFGIPILVMVGRGLVSS